MTKISKVYRDRTQASREIARIYKSSSPDDGVIYSPFLGSGTDIIAGEKLEGDRYTFNREIAGLININCGIIVNRNRPSRYANTQEQ